MSNQEAEQRINRMLSGDQNDLYLWKCKDREALRMAISALEKQIPVKATFDSDMDYVECPVCCQLTNADGFPEDINYCYHCGQAFDWEGEA